MMIFLIILLFICGAYCLMITRNMIRALLIALLETPLIRTAEAGGDFTTRLALQEEAKSLPFGAVWDYYCLKSDAPVGEEWLAEVKCYEKEVLNKRW